MLKRTSSRFLLLALGFFVLYALTAQRGLGWGDSAEFQDWVLNQAGWVCGPQFSNAHPFYVAFCRLVAKTPSAVTLVSAFFGALAVGGLYLCTRRASLSALFGLSQMLWWLSTVAEVQTMSLAFTAFETALLISLAEAEPAADARQTRANARRLGLLALLSGLHLGVHNFAVLAWPALALLAVALVRRDVCRLGGVACAACAWLLGASFWLSHLVTRGPRDVLVGSYGAKVAGILPTNLTQTAFNFALAALSFAVPALLAWWNRRALRERLARLRAADGADVFLLVLFAVNFLFFVRYFVPDQSQFLLPTLFFAYVLLRQADLGGTRARALAFLQVLLPALFYLVASQLPTPPERLNRHPGRDDARYFILPGRIGSSPTSP